MAKGGSRGGARGRSTPGRRGTGSGSAPRARSSAAKAGAQSPAKARRPAPSPGPSPVPPAAPAMPATFTLGAIPGATPGKWIDTWKQRMPQTALELVPLAVADQRRALADGEVDAALVRLPLAAEGLHVIPLYDEVPVVVCAKDSHLTAADDLDAADLVGEVLIVPQDDVLGMPPPAGTVAPRFAAPADTGEAIATVATGVGVVVVPMSLARLHHRKDVEFRPLRGGPLSTVALAWDSARTTPAVDAFVGIVRGRTANSSRG